MSDGCTECHAERMHRTDCSLKGSVQKFVLSSQDDSFEILCEDYTMKPNDSSIKAQAFNAVYEDVRLGRLKNQTADSVSIIGVLDSLERNGFGFVRFDTVAQPTQLTRREATAKSVRESKSPCRSKWLT